jgi:hypothetical protein
MAPTRDTTAMISEKMDMIRVPDLYSSCIAIMSCAKSSSSTCTSRGPDIRVIMVKRIEIVERTITALL